MLLPFYVMRYEESAHIIGEDSEKLRRLLNNCASHSRYFSSDELDALFFFENKPEQMFVNSICIWYNKNMDKKYI